MPAVAAPSAIPPHAIPLWTDGLSLYTQLPGPTGPYVLRYPRTVAGLSAALGLITLNAFDHADGPATPTNSPPAAGTFAQQVAARDALRKLGVRI